MQRGQARGAVAKNADLEEAELSWIKEVQKSLKCKEKFGSWIQQLNLFGDDKGVVRC